MYNGEKESFEYDLYLNFRENVYETVRSGQPKRSFGVLIPLCLSVCLSGCLSVCPSFRPSVIRVSK